MVPLLPLLEMSTTSDMMMSPKPLEKATAQSPMPTSKLRGLRSMRTSPGVSHGLVSRGHTTAGQKAWGIAGNQLQCKHPQRYSRNQQLNFGFSSSLAAICTCGPGDDG